MDSQDLLYRIALTLVKGIGDITAKQIIENIDDISLLFKGKNNLLEHIPGLSKKIIYEIRRTELLQRAEKEILFIEKNKIIPLYINDVNYPERLKDCADAPVLLYLHGDVDLNTRKIVSIVGTRNATNYGKEITERIVRGISEVYPETFIVSGLAYGIDIYSHKSALKNHLPTMGVLAHGLDRIYPLEHRNIAVEMLNNGGGLLTDFISGTEPDRYNFVKRNRIIAGISDCTVIVESAEKGGAMITARLADSYNRDIFAVPGKATDTYSMGCNALIKNKQAALITCAADIFKEMGWSGEKEPKKASIQQKIFVDLTSEEQSLVDFLSKNGNQQVNLIGEKLAIPMNRLSSLLFELEMKGIVRNMPGGMYSLV